MPTQEQINAANVELQIANDNYAQLQNKIDRYNQIFEQYMNASPEVQKKAANAMQIAIDDYNNLRLQQYANEDRIAVAQNAVNSINEQLVATPSTTNYWGQRRRTTTAQPQTVAQPAVEQPVVNQPATYTAPQYTPTQRNINLQKGVMPEQPLYTTYTPQYKNNTLWGIARNTAWQVRNDWGNAWRERSNVVVPRLKNAANFIGNAAYNGFYKMPVQAATSVHNFVFGKPQQRI